ncbi:hypothetical protein GCM10023153_31410 [Ornithinibacter aureus]|uniref:Bacterial HORMA domain-containing protein n=1 Tax=Ornithinibacter aureus TaxID=622664 RepID=A0ABP8KA90_9MICO|nr:hypothetical protein [Ornithinibacter aureus]KAF0833904.1 hypothetical protein C8E84_1707 [Ornithinibacter aureus]
MSTWTSTNSYVATWTQVATHLTSNILGTLAEAIAQLGLAPNVVTDDWENNEAAVTQWISERSLKAVSVEFTSPAGRLLTVVEFPVTYHAGGVDDVVFAASKDRIRRFLTKLPRLPAGTKTRLFVQFHGPRSIMPGWSPGTSADRKGLRSTSAGTLASAPGASASMTIYD